MLSNYGQKSSAQKTGVLDNGKLGLPVQRKGGGVALLVGLPKQSVLQRFLDQNRLCLWRCPVLWAYLGTILQRVPLDFWSLKSLLCGARIFLMNLSLGTHETTPP